MYLERRYRVPNFEAFASAVNAHHGWGFKISVVPDKDPTKGQIATYGSSSFGIYEPRYVYDKLHRELTVQAPEPMNSEHQKLRSFWAALDEGARIAGGSQIQL